MFNLYSKLTTAFLAVSIIFSTNLYSQLSYIAAGTYEYENGFTVYDCDGGVLLAVAVGELGTTNVLYDLVLPEGYSIELTDDYGDGWNGNYLAIDSDNGAADVYGDGCFAYTSYPTWCGGYDTETFVSGEMCSACGGGVGTFTIEAGGTASFNLGSCGLPACEDAAACNYGSEGDCTYPLEGFDCDGNLICAEGETLISFGAGSYPSETSWSITACDASLEVVLTGGGADSQMCMALPASYTITMNDSWGDGWNGAVLMIGDASYSVDINGVDGSSASVFVGEGESCPVCSDATACNFDAFGDCVFAEEGFDCDGNALPTDCIEISYTVSGGSYPAEVSWAILDGDGNSVLEGDAGENGVSGTVCLEEACYTFMGMDQFGDGWNGAVASFVNGGTEILNFTFTDGLSASAEFCVSSDIPGCTNEAASNYNAEATVDDGSCCLGDFVTINLYDQFADGWCFYPTNDPEGGLVFEGVFYPFCAGAQLSLDFCLEPGCYGGEIVGTNYTGEITWDVVVGGEIIASGGYGDFFFETDPTDACIVYGCNDDIACNFEPLSNVNDGSCDYLSCAGCTDAGACNYDDTATLDDASCDYSCVGCMDSTAVNYDADATIPCEDCCVACEQDYLVLTMYDSYGDGWNGNSLDINGTNYCFPDANGDCFSTNVFLFAGNELSSSLCLDLDECFVVTYNDDGAYQGENSWDIVDGDGNVVAEGSYAAGTQDGYFGSCTIGCSDDMSCNYDGSDINDGSCDYSCIGCMDNTAANFDPNATMDSGECVYCEPGSFVMTVNMTDSFGDGWSGAEYFIFDLNGDGLAVASGSLDEAFNGDGLTAGYDLICLAPGCYNVQVTEGLYPTEVGVSLTDQFGNNYGSFGAGATYPVDFLLTGACGFEGCTSPTAINYNISATVDDGSCQEPPANNLLENAEPLFCGAYDSGTLLYATDDQGLIGSQFGNASVTTGGVWYVFNSDSDQQVIASTCDTPSNEGDTDYTTDTKLHVYTTGTDGSLNAIAGNDDGCATGFLSTVSFNAVTGSDYYIHVSEYSDFTNGNDFVLSVECIDCGDAPSNDDCDGAVAQVTGVTFTGSTCCASAEEMELGWAGFGTAYGVWFTFNSAEFDTFYFDITNISNDVLGFVMMNGNSCEEVVGFVGCQFTGNCAGSVEGFLPELEPNVDYYFLIYTTDPTACGDFEFTTTGITLGCTDATANNYNPDANQDDGSCDFVGVVPANDLCADAITLECNTVTIGSTGGATSLGAPVGVDGCEVSPGTGVWYTFVGDGQLHNLSTCGSAIDSKINIYTAEEACGGGSYTEPPVDACAADGGVSLTAVCGGSSYESEMSWEVLDASGSMLASGAAGTSTPFCVPADESLTVNMYDSYGDTWDTGSLTLLNNINETVFYGTVSANDVVDCEGNANPPAIWVGDGYCDNGDFGAYFLCEEWNWDAGDCGLEEGQVVDPNWVAPDAGGDVSSAQVTVSNYSSDPILVPGDFDCFATASASDGTGACSLFDNDDVNFEFVSDPGVLYYVYVGAQDADANPITDDNGAFDLVFDCAPVVEGCMNPAACNYDVNANVSTDTCDFWSCVCEGVDGVAVMLNMVDAFGDGWNNAGYTITDLMGNSVAEGSLDDAQFFVDNDNFAGPENGFDMICLPAGCYLINVTPGDWAAEVSWDIMLEDGTVLAAGGAPTDNLTISVGGAVCGCTDAGACNYDETATDEDGSCEYETCAGCTDAGSCSYDESATIDDGSCCYSNCVDIQMFDSFGDGWNGASYVLTSVDGTEVGTGTIDVGSNATDSYCLADGCYTISVDDGSWPTEVTWNVLGAFGGLVSGGASSEATFNVGSGDQCVVGCDISCACNYDPAANISDADQCVFEGCDGCTYPDASNYDEAAVSDNGTCVFDIANPCPADLNADGSITTGDLLIFLGAFGTICE